MLVITYHKKTKSMWCTRKGSIGFRIYEDEIQQLKSFFENLKTSPNKDFTVQNVSPKVCPDCGLVE